MHKADSTGGIIIWRPSPSASSFMATDLHLLSRYHLHGDAKAFQSLVEAHAGMVHATACRVTRNAALAQEVAGSQEIEYGRRLSTSDEIKGRSGRWLRSERLNMPQGFKRLVLAAGLLRQGTGAKFGDHGLANSGEQPTTWLGGRLPGWIRPRQGALEG